MESNVYIDFENKNIKPKKIISDFYSEYKLGINFQKIKEKLKINEFKIKDNNKFIHKYIVSHNPNYSYLVRSYLVWKLPKIDKKYNYQFNDILLKSTLRINYDKFGIIGKEINISNHSANIFRKLNNNTDDYLFWTFNKSKKLSFPLFKMKGNILEEIYQFEYDIDKIIEVYDDSGNKIDMNLDIKELIPEVWADYIITDSIKYDLRYYYCFDDVNEIITSNHQSSFNINHLTKTIYVQGSNISSIITDIFSIDGIKEYDPVHFSIDDDIFEFRLIEEDDYLPEYEFSRVVNFKFKKEEYNNDEIKIIIISRSIIDFRKMKS